MRKWVGVWVDHTRATIIWVNDEQVQVEHIEAGVIGKHGLAVGAQSRTPWGPQDVACGGKMGQRRHQHVQMFLARVIDMVADAEQILLLGRGVLTSRLGKRISESKALSVRLADVIDTDRTSERQIVLKVREFYGALPRRGDQRGHWLARWVAP
jgi:hypothetical protein